MTISLTRIDNMDILTRDVSRLVEFYHGTLGLPFFLPYRPEEGWAAIDCGNLTLYLFHTEHSSIVARRTAVNAADPVGLDSFAFEVADLDSAIAELGDTVEWVHDEVTLWQHPSGTWYRYRPFFDPDGTMIYITEPHKPAVGLA